MKTNHRRKNPVRESSRLCYTIYTQGLKREANRKRRQNEREMLDEAMKDNGSEDPVFLLEDELADPWTWD